MDVMNANQGCLLGLIACKPALFKSETWWKERLSGTGMALEAATLLIEGEIDPQASPEHAQKVRDAAASLLEWASATRLSPAQMVAQNS